MTRAAEICGLVSILFGFAAAVLWIGSSLVDLSVPTDRVLLDGSNAFIAALRHAAGLHGWAAGLTGVSVLLAAVERGIRFVKR